MSIRVRNLIVALVGIVILSSCSGYEKVLKSNDVNYKLVKANEYYEKKKYAQANAIYESLLPVMKHTKNYEALYYRYAYSFYYLKDYLSASYHFKNFVDFFPGSKDAEECEYLHGECLYKESPAYPLDQTYTYKALDALQSFINTHPNSKRIDEASKIIEKGRLKIQKKELAAADLYYDIGQYKAAAVSFEKLLIDYPDESFSDYCQYMLLKSWYKYARISIEEKQEERYASAITAYKELKDEYPKSEYIPDAEKYYTLADNSIKKIRNEHK